MTTLTWGAADLDERYLEKSVIHESRDGHTDSAIELGYRSAIGTKKHIGQFAESTAISGLIRQVGVYDATSDKTFVTFSQYNIFPWVAAYDHGTGTWDGPYQVSSTYPIGNDDHGVPGMGIDPNGFLYVAWGSHNSDQYWTKSVNARDPSSWETEKTISDQVYTYPRWHWVGSDIYLWIRGNTFRYGFVKSTDDGATWDAFKAVLGTSDSDVNRVYIYGVYYDGTDFHLTWNYWDSNDFHHGTYYGIYSPSNDNLTAADGTTISSLPMEKSTADANNFLVHDSKTNSNQAQNQKVDVDQNGNPHIIFTLEDSGASTWNLVYTMWDGTSWTALTTLVETRGSGDTIPDIEVHSDTDIDVWTSISPDSVIAGGHIEQWHYDGSSWSKVRRIMDNSDSEFKFDNPMRIENAHSDARLMFCEADDGEYGQPYLHTFVWGDSGFLEADFASAFAYFPLDETSGSTATDHSGSGSDASINGGVTLGASGLLGTTCFDFDGSTGYCDFSGVSMDMSNGFTVAVSLNPDSWPTNQVMAFQLTDSAGHALFIQRNSSGPVIEWGYYDGSTAHKETAGDIATGTWVRLVCTYTHQQGRWRIYKDGALVAETQNTDNYIVAEPTFDGDSNILGALDSSQRFFDGQIEDFIFDQHAWLGYEVVEDYNAWVSGNYVSSKKAA